MSQVKLSLLEVDELDAHILSYLDPASLQRAAMINKTMQALAMNPKLWRGFLAEDARGTSVDPRKDVIDAIKAKDYPKLTPECLLQMLYADTIGIEEFDGLFGALSQKQDQVSKKISNLITTFRYTCVQKNFTKEDFTGLNVKQIEVIVNYYNNAIIYMKETHLKPQDFAMLNAEQIKATMCYQNSAEQLFKIINLKPQDFVTLSAEQIKATMYHQNSAERLFKIINLKPQDISKFTPAGIRFLFKVGFNTKQLKDIITDTPEKYSYLLQNGPQLLTQEQIEATSSEAELLFNQYALTASDLAPLTPKQIEAVSSRYRAEKLFVKCKLTTKDIAKFSPAGIRFLCDSTSLLSIEQLKDIIANSQVQYTRLLLGSPPLDLSALSTDQIKALDDGSSDAAEKLFIGCNLTPQDIAQLIPEQIKKIIWGDTAETLFIKCGLKPQDIAQLSPKQIEIIAWGNNAATLFIKCGLKPQDIAQLSHNGITFLLNSQFSKDELKSIIDNPREQYARLLKDAYHGDITGLTAEQIAVITKDYIILRLFIECELTTQDLITLSPQQIEALSHPNAHKLFSTSGLKPKNLSQFDPSGLKFLLESTLDIDQLKDIIANPQGKYIRLLINADNLDFSGLTQEQIKAFDKWGGSHKLFTQCNFNPQNFKEFSPEQIIKITWSDNAETLFIKCGLKPQDIAILNGNQMHSILSSYNAKKLFIQCHLKTQDIMMLNGEQIQYIANDIESFIQHGLKPQDFAQFSPWGIRFLLTSSLSTEKLKSIIDNPHTEYSRLLKDTDFNDFTGLDQEQIEAIKSYGNTYLFFIECQLKSQDFAMLTAEQIKATQHYYRSPETVFRQHKLKPQDFVGIDPEKIKVISSRVDVLLGEYGFKPQDFVEFSTEYITAISSHNASFATIFTSGTLTLKDLNILSPAQITSISSSAPMLFSKCGFKPQDFVMLTAEQIKAMTHYSNSAEILFIESKLTPQDFSMLDPNQIEALSGYASKYFSERGFKPQHFGPFTPEGIIFLHKASFNPEQLKAIIANPQEKYSHLLQNATHYLTPKQIEATSRGAELLFNKCALTASDLSKFTPNGITTLIKSSNPQSILADIPEALLTPEYLASIKTQDCATAIPPIDPPVIGDDLDVVDFV